MQTKQVFLIGQVIGPYTILGVSFRIKNAGRYFYCTVVEVEGKPDVRFNQDIQLAKSLPHIPKRLENHPRLARIYGGMRQRCENEKCEAYHYYGARGIQVCDEWKDVDNFVAWALANGYQNNLTLDRKDNFLGYSPANCRWATWKEQANNTRRHQEARNRDSH